ncbi:amidohydrolase [Diaphorobacter ruginosibacter]|uniref:Amidohydrolase n=1 Tax=Diaphorobacter ruginosibacter TaxID=1715720 RepID=A0A7G9RIW9_9BURK|nr:amidohydrolase [Diaphorobacter ruginosibacter]QNN55544.1 amidohydrolase [Diaphorobacter ruginosibacter]
MKKNIPARANTLPEHLPQYLLRLSAAALGAAVLLSGCGGSGNGLSAKDAAQIVYRNGDILTLDKDNTVVQAIGIKDGKIIASGSSATVDALVGPDTKVVDLKGKSLIPGFYDAHSHFVYTGTNARFETDLNSPPIGQVRSIDDMVALLQKKQAELGKDAWITGFGYDDTLLAERRHPTREDLDRVSTTQPVYVTHISGHMAVANSFALAKAGINASSTDPEGGMIGRDKQGQPDGFLAETAQGLVGNLKPGLTAAQVQEGIQAAAQIYASHGVTTANDGASSAGGIQAMEAAAQGGRLPLRVVAWPTALQGMEAAKKVELKSGMVKIGGIKDFYDGSIQGYTGYLSEPYHTPHDGDAHYRGYPRTSKANLIANVEAAHKAGYQLFIHTNGDQAISDVLEAYAKAQQASPRADARHTLIHAQMAREDQLDEMKKLGVIPSFFELHTYYWGDRHRDIFLGPDRGARISPAQSARQRGLPFTLHADTPVVPMDPLLMVWAAVNRVTTGGSVLGADQRISPTDALRALTINAAHQNFEEKERGSIEVGKHADLVVLSDNPTKVDPMKIRNIEVLQTIVGGKQVYAKPGQ